MTNPNSSTSIRPLPESWVEQLFERMLFDYGKKFTDQWGAADMDKLIAHWSTELAGYRGAELDRGVAAMAGRDWPPTLPEFKRLCRPGVDPMRAYYEALAGIEARGKGELGTWSHPAIFWAAWPMRRDLREQTFSAVKAKWEAALQQQLDKGAWDLIPQPVFELTAPGQSLTTSEKAKATIANLVGNVINRAPPADRLGWARQVLERAAAGEKLTPTTVQMAREALATEN